jgi:hypothetical protein
MEVWPTLLPWLGPGSHPWPWSSGEQNVPSEDVLLPGTLLNVSIGPDEETAKQLAGDNTLH